MYPEDAITTCPYDDADEADRFNYSACERCAIESHACCCSKDGEAYARECDLMIKDFSNDRT